MKRILIAMTVTAFLILLAGCQKNAIQAPAAIVPAANEKMTNNLARLIPDWHQISVPTTYGRKWAIGFSIGSEGYIGGGEGFPPGASAQFTLQDFWQYDPATNTWTQEANIPYGVRSAATFVLGTQGYVVSGYHEPPAGTSDVPGFIYHTAYYDQASNSWNFKKDFPGEPRYAAVGTTIGGMGYIGTGNGKSNALNDWWQYNSATDTWTQKSPVPGGWRNNAVAFSANNIGYVCSGWSQYYNGNDMWEYLSVLNRWVRATDLPAIGRAEATGFNWGQGGMVIGGNSSGSSPTALNDVWSFDPSASQWTQHPNIPGNGRGGAVGFSINGTPYIGTGYNFLYDNELFLSDFYYLDSYIL